MNCKYYFLLLESDEVGIIKWVFEIDDTNRVFDSVDVYFDYMLYENGNVEVAIVGNLEKIALPSGKTNILYIVFFFNYYYII